MLKTILVLSLLIPLTSWAEDTIFLRTLAGKQCSQSLNQHIECAYTIGNDLKFVIGPIGDDHNSVTFLRSSFSGDYYASFGMLHGCVIVKAGRKTIEANKRALGQYAFISPRTGKVYNDWVECKAAK